MRISAVILFILISYGMHGQSFIVSPTNPEKGSMITLSYNHESDSSDKSGYKVMVYVLRLGEMPVVEVLDLDSSSNVSSVQFRIHSDVDGLLFKVINSDNDIVDDNNGKAHQSLIYKSGHTESKSKLALAEALTFYRFQLRIDEQHEFCKVLIDEELAANPEIAISDSYIFTYGANARNINDKSRISSILAYSQKVRNNKVTEQELLMIADLFEKMFYSNTDVLNQTNWMFPDSEAALRIKLKDFNSKKLKQKVKSIKGIDRLLIEKRKYLQQYDFKCNDISYQYMKRDDLSNAILYAEKISCPVEKAGAYYSIAYSVSGNKKDISINLDTALYYCKKSIALIGREKSIMKMRKPYIAKFQYKRRLSFTLSYYFQTYSNILYQLGRKNEALKYAKMAVIIDKYGNPITNAKYTDLMIELNLKEESKIFLEKMIYEGEATISMKEQYKSLLIDSQFSSLEIAERLDSLEKVVNSDLDKKVLSKISRGQKHSFKLKSLYGDKVSLDDYEGKVLVIDFWATWCPPCRKALPGMEHTADKYDNDKVEFVYVTTETDKDEIKEFMLNNNYDFKVLIDNKREMSDLYKVKGIPRKFVLDTLGNIRYDSQGFDGNDSKLLDELSLVIDTILEEQVEVSIEP